MCLSATSPFCGSPTIDSRVNFVALLILSLGLTSVNMTDSNNLLAKFPHPMITKCKTLFRKFFISPAFGAVLLCTGTLSACVHTDIAELTASESAKKTQLDHKTASKRTYKPLPEGSLEHILLAELALRRHALNKALPLLAEQTAITESPSLAITTAKLADYLGETSISEAATELWLQHYPNDEEAHEIYVKNMIISGDYIKAYDTIQRDNNPHQTAQLIQLASSAIRSQNAASQTLVKTMFKRTLQTDKNNIGVLVGTALLAEATGETDIDGLALIRRANKLAPSDPMVANIKAAVESDKELYQDAYDTLDRALVHQPQHYGLKRHQAGILVNLDPEQAFGAYKSLYTLSPNDVKVVQPLAQLSVKFKDFELAEELLTKLSYDPAFSDFASYSLGAISEQREQAFTAMQFYSDVKEEPYLFASLRRYELLSTHYNNSVEFERHLDALRSSKQGSELIDITVHQAEYFLRVDKVEQANVLVNDALGTNPSDNKLLYTSFMVQQTLGNYQQAVKPLETMVKRHPDNPTILNALGYTLSRYLGEHARAVPLIESALNISPNDPAIMDSMGWVRLQQGDVDEAFGYFASAYKLSEHIDIAVHLAEVLWLKDKQDEALQLLKKIWQQDASNVELLDTLQRLDIQLQ